MKGGVHMGASNQPINDSAVLNVFCSPEGDAWRIYVHPRWVPSHLRSCLDGHCEAYPVEFDLEDLDRYMGKSGAEYEKSMTKIGCVELTARGKAAVALATWLSNAFASGVRAQGGSAPGSGRQTG